MKIRVQMMCAGVSCYLKDFDSKDEALTVADMLSQGLGKFMSVATQDDDIIRYENTLSHIRVFEFTEKQSEVLFYLGDAPDAATMAEANVRKVLGLLSGKKIDDPSINAAIQKIIDQPNVSHTAGVFQLQYRGANSAEEAGQ